MDTITTPQQVPSNSPFAPDRAAPTRIWSTRATATRRPPKNRFSRRSRSKPTQGNDSGSIPLGLRDLVKDYFSSLDKK